MKSIRTIREGGNEDDENSFDRQNRSRSPSPQREDEFSNQEDASPLSN
jgi:hypothetical protein